ncbi:MAG: fumarate reductase subunit C [Gemmatimonadetes bacterium]|uniref:Fumarate reductase subunit C n=1 Tax=Candidatus Kutchimonas denitrificans TaxID=3056748 RepID=A0AAE4Z947_9BACT|nr:fumarate reductase subunit C [Gemmatimonadota bacterium]NIR75938.1 fumarate reductase subunit C [Candidatus Kutchimonas denitrificans]NIS02096.1 fumarate reductase subunit C [Gemmatimonadota bacterium]NIT67921.1 fumarate reductase subunit C [Gemmatimonadota bacterium]NIU53915.1 fumarate reductase subunit C [Gemmatimonadota bacterium]
MVRAVNPDYTPHHPKWYRRRIPIFWWIRKRAYVKFIARELTSPFVAYAAALLLMQVWALARGGAAYARFLAWLQLGPVLIWHGALLIILLFHTVTWLNLAPKAIVLHVRGRRIPDAAVVAGHYAAWLAVSTFLVWLLVRGW